MPAKKKFVQKPITYCIDGSNLVSSVWLEESTTESQQAAGTKDFLKWLKKVHSAPTHTAKHFRVVFDTPPLAEKGKKSAKTKGFNVLFSNKGKLDNVLITEMRSAMKKRSERVVVVSAESAIHQAARSEGIRCITPHDFLMIFQAVI